MNKAVPVLLVFLLSGVPATAIVCDLLLCVKEPTAEVVQGCHEHGDQPSGDVISPATGGCTHLSDAAPFVPSGLRVAHGARPVALLPAPVLPPNAHVALVALSTRGAPAPLQTLALRI